MVQDGIYDDFVSRLKQRISRIVIGSGLDSGGQMGPVQSAQQRDKILRMVEQGIAEGARLVCGGKRLHGDRYEKGFWLEPTLLADVTARQGTGRIIAHQRHGRHAKAPSRPTRPRKAAGPIAQFAGDRPHREFRRAAHGELTRFGASLCPHQCPLHAGIVFSGAARLACRNPVNRRRYTAMARPSLT